MGKLDGKVAIITGGGSGIGRATALLFAEEGAKISIFDWKKKKGDETAKMIRERGGEAISLFADVSKSKQVQRAIKETVRKFSGLNILVNNAGVWIGKSILHTTEAQWDKAFDINAKGVFLCSKYAVPEIEKSGGGSIVNIGSTEGPFAIHDETVYGATKGAIITLTKGMSVDHAPNIRVNILHPGTTLTPMMDGLLKNYNLPLEDVIHAPLGRAGTLKDVAKAALFMASDDSSYITGTELMIDGGWTARLETLHEPKPWIKTTPKTKSTK